VGARRLYGTGAGLIYRSSVIAYGGCRRTIRRWVVDTGRRYVPRRAMAECIGSASALNYGEARRAAGRERRKPITRGRIRRRSVQHELYSIRESPVQKGVIWAGSNDGLIHV